MNEWVGVGGGDAASREETFSRADLLTPGFIMGKEKARRQTKNERGKEKQRSKTLSA